LWINEQPHFSQKTHAPIDALEEYDVERKVGEQAVHIQPQQLLFKVAFLWWDAFAYV